MSQEIFRKLRQMLMEKLDVYRELTDQEILETIDELIVNTLRESGVSLKEKVQKQGPTDQGPCSHSPQNPAHSLQYSLRKGCPDRPAC